MNSKINKFISYWHKKITKLKGISIPCAIYSRPKGEEKFYDGCYGYFAFDYIVYNSYSFKKCPLIGLAGVPKMGFPKFEVGSIYHTIFVVVSHEIRHAEQYHLGRCTKSGCFKPSFTKCKVFRKYYSGGYDLAVPCRYPKLPNSVTCFDLELDAETEAAKLLKRYKSELDSFALKNTKILF